MKLRKDFKKRNLRRKKKTIENHDKDERPEKDLEMEEG